MVSGAKRLVGLVLAVWGGLFSFYGFLGWRTRLWSPAWAIAPTTREPEPAAGPQGPEGTARGRRLYREARCGVCHGPEGQGGVKNPNADPDGVVPNLYDLAEGFTRSDLEDKLRKGARPAKLEEDGPQPPLDMPAWRVVLDEEDIDALAEYLLTLKAPPGSGAAEADDGKNGTGGE